MTVEQFQSGNRVIDRWNNVFEALTAEPRRQLIAALVDAPADQPVVLPEAAASPTVHSDLDFLQVDLRHTHLPLLDDAGFVRYESEPFRAYRGPRFEEVATVIETLHDAAADLPDSLVNGCQRLEEEHRLRD